MRITANRMLDLAGQATVRAQSDVADLAGQVSSGRRVERPSDDPVAWAHARRLELRKTVSEGRGVGVALGRDQLEETDRALGAIGGVLAQARELAVQAATANYNATDRAAMGQVITGMFQTARAAANTRTTSGEYLLAGMKSGTEPFDAAGAYQGDSATRALESGEGPLDVATVPGSVLTAAGGVDVLPALTRFAAALAANDLLGIQKSIDELSTAHGQVSRARTNVGSLVSVLDGADQARAGLEDTLQGRIAGLTEIDVVTAAGELAQRSRALEAAQAVNSKLAQLLSPR